jgi:hypothetical protein
MMSEHHSPVASAVMSSQLLVSCDRYIYRAEVFGSAKRSMSAVLRFHFLSATDRY